MFVLLGNFLCTSWGKLNTFVLEHEEKEKQINGRARPWVVSCDHKFRKEASQAGSQNHSCEQHVDPFCCPKEPWNSIITTRQGWGCSTLPSLAAPSLPSAPALACLLPDWWIPSASKPSHPLLTNQRCWAAANQICPSIQDQQTPAHWKLTVATAQVHLTVISYSNYRTCSYASKVWKCELPACRGKGQKWLELQAEHSSPSERSQQSCPSPSHCSSPPACSAMIKNWASADTSKTTISDKNPFPCKGTDVADPTLQSLLTSPQSRHYNAALRARSSICQGAILATTFDAFMVLSGVFIYQRFSLPSAKELLSVRAV